MEIRLKHKNKKGKPRRARGIAPVSSVRIDIRSKNKLIKYFGSLGNALYFLYQGIENMKDEYGLPSDNVENRNFKLDSYDFECIYIALRWYANTLRDEKTKSKFLNLSTRIRQTVFEGDKYDETAND
jgi:hypothetical protein